MNSSAKVVVSPEGVSFLPINDSQYRINKSIGNKHYWRCRKTKICKACVITEYRNSKHVVVKSSEHTHENNRSVINGKPKFEKIKEEQGGGLSYIDRNQSGNKILKTSDNQFKQVFSGSGPKIFIDEKHFRFKHPFTCMLAGPTSSGKTVLMRRILRNYDKTIHFKEEIPVPLRVMWAYGQWQSIYNQKLDKCTVKYIDGLPSEEEILTFNPHIIIIDDLMTELGNNKNLAALFTKGSHHMGISIVFITQNIYHQGTQMRTISLNCHYMLLMKNPKDKRQIITLASQLYPNQGSFFIDAYEAATKNQYGYIRVDHTQDTPELYRVQTRITPEEKPENCKYLMSPYCFMPK